MINDKDLTVFLSKKELVTLVDIELLIGMQGEKLVNWQLRCNQLSPVDMYSQYKTVVSQLTQANIPDKKRLELFEEVQKIIGNLLVNLHQLYKSQVGILAHHQQQALDMVLSIYYLNIVFYNNVWQRVVNNPNVKKGFGSLLGLGNANSQDDIIKQCLYGMMSFLRQALFEKQIGYRKDTQIIWQWLNVCYHFMQAKGWQNFAYTIPLLSQSSSSAGKPLTLQSVYYQCLLSEVINPYACRRPDMIMWQKYSNEFVKDLIVSNELLEKPYLFINLKSNEPPTLLHPQIHFNPFAKDSFCLFLGFSKLATALKQLILAGQNSEVMEDKIHARFGKMMLENLHKNLTMPEMLGKTNLKCQVVGGFYHVHYVLANKTSLGNLIQANTLAERLRPRVQNNTELNKSLLINLVEASSNIYHLNSQLSYEQSSNVQIHTTNRGSDSNPLSHLQVGSMVATRLVDDPNKIWILGKINSISQSVLSYDSFENDKPVRLKIDINISLLGKGIIPCGVRLANSGTRPPHFVPAMMIPRNDEFKRPVTSIMMARFGYQIDDKLVMRINDKEVLIRLTELLSMTDDIEEYAFVRVQ